MKGHYLLGQSLVHLERYDDAVIALQTVSFEGDRFKFLNAILLGAKVRSRAAQKLRRGDRAVSAKRKKQALAKPRAKKDFTRARTRELHDEFDQP